MVNNEVAKTQHITVADQTAWYSVGFPYGKNPATGAPEIAVTLDGSDLLWGADYLFGEAGIQLTVAPEAGLDLIIVRNIPLTQQQDFQTGLISADQIEKGFDRSVMRDQMLREEIEDYFFDIESFESRVEAIENEVDNLAAVASTGDYGDLLNKPILSVVALTGAYSDLIGKPSLATVATSGSYNDLTNKPSLATVATSGEYDDLLNKPNLSTMQVTTNLVTSVSSASTDSQYPSAKLFYDTCGDIETLINAL